MGVTREQKSLADRVARHNLDGDGDCRNRNRLVVRICTSGDTYRSMLLRRITRDCGVARNRPERCKPHGDANIGE